MKAASAFGLGLLAFMSVLACSSNDGGGAYATGGRSDAANGGASASGGSPPSGTAGSVDLEALDAPDETQALVAFLEAKQYADWAKEFDIHPSAGPHGEGVRVYYSPKAAAALNSGAATFPAGAASVKELTSGGSLYGYSVWVKVQDAADGGNGFFWYEAIHQPDGSDIVSANTRGSSACVGCHRAGKDYLLSNLPFE